MIILIWFVYFVSILVLVIFALNFLIAIVSQSYESIMDRQQEAIIKSRSELNQECMQELNPEKDKEVEILVLQTSVNFNADSEWDGVS